MILHFSRTPKARLQSTAKNTKKIKKHRGLAFLSKNWNTMDASDKKFDPLATLIDDVLRVACALWVWWF